MTTVGIDEVGRGCWAGPLVAGAVILKDPIPGLKDSKKLSKKRRDTLAPIIYAEALAVGIGWVWPKELDAVGITVAVKLAMERAVEQIAIEYDDIIIDGNINYLPKDARAKAIIKADDTVPAVSAASIVAKVARDNYMAEQAIIHPEYGFEKHVGYGTVLHIASLKAHGITELHRRSFKPIQNMLESRT